MLSKIAAKNFRKGKVGKLEITQIVLDTSEAQNGFRPGKGCIDRLFTVVNMIHNRLMGNKSNFVAFIDLRKAYDSVNRDLLWKKLQRIGISKKMIIMIKNLYDGVSCCVKLDNSHISDLFRVLDKGVSYPHSYLIFLLTILQIAYQVI